MTTLDRLVSLRSQRALGLKAYLEAFVDITARRSRPAPFLGSRSLVELDQPPDVVKRNRLDRTFLEYLAAVWLAGQGPAAVTEGIAAHAGDPNWREVSLLAVAHLSVVRKRRGDASAVVEEVVRRATARLWADRRPAQPGGGREAGRGGGVDG